MSLTVKEIDVTRILGKAFGKFAKLPVVHPADLDDFEFHVHALQNIVMSRAAVRDHPDEFHHEEGTVK